jgi:predicted dehydrogenase
MRFGLFGTGYWAAEVHAAALAAAAPEVELVGVWGRDPAKAAALADRYGTRPYSEVDALIADVEAIDVALPPDVQAPIAARAAAAGKHLLLDKPLALTESAADEVVSAVRASGVASVVFFTSRFAPATAGWLDAQAGRDWHGAEATWVGSIFEPDNPFGASPWRRELGGLWDVGPHSLSMTVPLLGPVERVTSAVRDQDGTVRFVARHTSGAQSVQTVGIDVPSAASTNRLAVYGAPGWAAMPEDDADSVEALGIALQQLLANAAAGTSSHPCDVAFAAQIGAALAQAQALLDA